MTTIYVVTEGQYSDYHIVGLYSTIEMATKCKEAVNADDIECFELNSGDFRLYDLGYKVWHVRFSGDVTEATEYDYYQEKYPMDSWVHYNRNTKTMSISLYAKDEKHAIKIASEYRAQVIASGEIEKYYAKLDEEDPDRHLPYFQRVLKKLSIEELESKHNEPEGA